MKRQAEILRITRKNILKLASGLSEEQLNKIPENFNNNIAWNLGHLVVTQQLLCYKLSNLPCKISQEMIDKYRKGSSPQGKIEMEEIEEIKALLFSLIDATEEDYSAGLFKEYKEYTTSYNVTLHSFEEAFNFNNLHEGLHLGYCIALKKVL